MRLIGWWIWWQTVILLFLRSELINKVEAFENPTKNGLTIDITDQKDVLSLTNNSEKNEETEESELLPKTAEKMGMIRCETNYDCVHNGVCAKGIGGYGVCLCPKACPATIPTKCSMRHTSSPSCLLMDQDYRSKFNVPPPACHLHQCVCPPQFTDYQVSSRQLPLRLNTTLFPTRCDKRDLKVIGKAYPSSSVYKGTDATLFCCLNIDPEGYVDTAGVFFVQNTTIMREATGHPFKEAGNSRIHEYNRKSTTMTDRLPCWELEIKNAQPSDSGSYMCIVTASEPNKKATFTIDFEVKAPRMIQKLKVNATEKEAVITWESDVTEGGGAAIPIDLRPRRHRRTVINSTIDKELMRRTDNKGQVVFSRDNATSPVVVKNLRAATPYTLFVSGKDGTVPFEVTEHFSTNQKKPHPPKEEDVRILNSGSSLSCEVEWKPPAETNGRIIKYFVSVRGEMRKTRRPDSGLTPDDYPLASEADKRCANWDGDDAKTEQYGINPIDFSTDFFSCKFGPLKPNRNYTVSVWAENSAGRSKPALFKKSCVTSFSQPEVIEKPQTSLSANESTFLLTFDNEPDDINGPISCYYIAIVPLPRNVSLDALPPTNEIVMDSFSKVFANNLHTSSAEKKRYFAYVAESYSSYPKQTIIGDGSGLVGLKSCNVQYLSRYSAEDLALRTGLKYTGFLIARVDKEEEFKQKVVTMNPVIGQGVLRRIMENDRSRNPITRTNHPRKLRQLHLSGPAYGYSEYFKPILLDPEVVSSGGFGTAFKVLVPILIFLAMASAMVMFLVHRRKDVVSWCPLSKMLSKNVGERTLLKQSFGAVPVDDLPAEYVMRHRDSDFVFVQEFEALPHFQLEAIASNRKENLHKNRYNDIRAFDETRVKLNKIDNDETSDYINANYIKSWNGKKTFIAAQAPVDATLDDFWRMIWEQEALLIVMVANLSEKNRQQCSKYWPDDQLTRYGDILVQPLESSYYSDYAIRVFEVVHVDQCSIDPVSVEYANVPMMRGSACFGGGSSRRITQYHFMNWNDYKAPECSTGLLRFLHILRELPEFNLSPVVIHCSAGVGRTGTFITIDSMFDQCLEEGKADIYEFVVSLRKQRNLMVQSVEQYVFIYKALAEWHMYGYTDMDVEGFEIHYSQLKEPYSRERSASFNGLSRVVLSKISDKNGGSGTSGIEEEFKKLERNLGGQLSTSFASKDENLMKNRFEAAVPYDKFRVILSPTIGHADSTYINASHIRGYFYSYISAQDPVSEASVFDFWRMIADQRVSTIVMLSQEEDWSVSEKYWPEEEGCRVVLKGGKNGVEVEFEQEERFTDFVQRTLRFTMKDHEIIEHEVVQFAFTSWPSGTLVPQSSAAILSLISRVLERQSKLADSGPILVHCRNGSSETGIFICISLLLLRLKAEQRIDIFQTVKGLQNQRPMMFTKLEQYSFCYKAVSDYIGKTASTSLR